MKKELSQERQFLLLRFATRMLFAILPGKKVKENGGRCCNIVKRAFQKKARFKQYERRLLTEISSSPQWMFLGVRNCLI